MAREYATLALSLPDAACEVLTERSAHDMANERKTEDLVERRLRRLGYYETEAKIVVEKQSSDVPRIRKLLERASKAGKGAGRPEFLIRSAAYPDLIIVIECKASTRKHASATLAQYADFAVDGALLYASHLAREYDVIAIGVSGETEQTLRLSHYLHLRGNDRAVEYTSDDVVSFEDYYEGLLTSDVKFRQDYGALLDYSRALNNTLQAKKILEAQRGFLISGILIALQNKAFRQSFEAHGTAKQLASGLLESIRVEFENARLAPERHENLVQAFAFIKEAPVLISDRDFILSLIKGIDDNVNAFMRTHKFFDTIGEFYIEFLRYANNDKGLGIVLTPHHIADLFVRLADVNKSTVVYDNCCGTAGLLVAAMKAMIRDAGDDRKLHRRIKETQVIGIEYQTPIYALAVSNMILHGDGKTAICRGDCFKDVAAVLGERKPDVGILNPPYKNKQSKEDREELEFVLNNLDSLKEGGTCVAILPITCATAPDGAIAQWKTTILQRHTLEGVVSMPIELFHNSNTNVVTCVMVFTAHRAHPKAKKTWFGYWRNDGLVKTKHRGRVDANGSWPHIRDAWVNAYRNRDVVAGISVMRHVEAQDEWCAEAYLPTNYAAIDEGAMLDAGKRYIMSQVMRRAGMLGDGDVDGN